jgi:hypothetical protein
MKDWANDVTDRSRQRASVGKQPLVVRHADEPHQLEDVLERLTRLEATQQSPHGLHGANGNSWRVAKFDLRTTVGIGAILLSIASYVVGDARNTSRQDAEIESTLVRLTNLEKIAATNTEARVRTEVELEELRQGQSESKKCYGRAIAEDERAPPHQNYTPNKNKE